jgi:hypothetical protein
MSGAVGLMSLRVVLVVIKLWLASAFSPPAALASPGHLAPATAAAAAAAAAAPAALASPNHSSEFLHNESEEDRLGHY